MDNFATLNLGSYLEQYNGKPVLITKSGTVFTGTLPGGGTYIEMDANIHKFNILARKALSSMQDRIKEFEARIAFVIEGVTNDELPETLFGTVYLHNVDLLTAPKLFQ